MDVSEPTPEPNPDDKPPRRAWWRRIWDSWLGGTATNRHNGDYKGRHRKPKGTK